MIYNLPRRTDGQGQQQGFYPRGTEIKVREGEGVGPQAN